MEGKPVMKSNSKMIDSVMWNSMSDKEKIEYLHEILINQEYELKSIQSQLKFLLILSGASFLSIISLLFTVLFHLV